MKECDKCKRTCEDAKEREKRYHTGLCCICWHGKDKYKKGNINSMYCLDCLGTLEHEEKMGKQYTELYTKMDEMRKQIDGYSLFLRNNETIISLFSREELETHEKGYEYVFRGFRYLDNAVANLNNMSERIANRLNRVRKTSLKVREKNQK